LLKRDLFPAQSSRSSSFPVRGADLSESVPGGCSSLLLVARSPFDHLSSSSTSRRACLSPVFCSSGVLLPYFVFEVVFPPPAFLSRETDLTALFSRRSQDILLLPSPSRIRHFSLQAATFFLSLFFIILFFFYFLKIAGLSCLGRRCLCMAFFLSHGSGAFLLFFELDQASVSPPTSPGCLLFVALPFPPRERFSGPTSVFFCSHPRLLKSHPPLTSLSLSSRPRLQKYLFLPRPFLLAPCPVRNSPRTSPFLGDREMPFLPSARLPFFSHSSGVDRPSTLCPRQAVAQYPLPPPFSLKGSSAHFFFCRCILVIAVLFRSFAAPCLVVPSFLEPLNLGDIVVLYSKTPSFFLIFGKKSPPRREGSVRKLPPIL